MAIFGQGDNSLNIVIRAKDKASPVFKKAEKQLKKTSDSLIKTGKKLTLGLTAPIAFFGASMIKAASDAEETQSKFDTVFRGMEDTTNDWAESFAQDVGRSRQEIKAFTAGIADVLKPMGLQTAAAASMSKEMVKLALDVASFNNRQDTDVIRAFTSALTGERESLKTLGIVITEADVKQEAYQAGLAEVGSELTKTAKAQATMNLLFKNSKDAQGDLIRTGESFANQSKRLKGELANLSETLGEELLPIATKMVKAISALTGQFEGMNEAQRKVFLSTLAVIATVGPAMILFGKLAKGLIAYQVATIGAVGATVRLRAALAFLGGPIGLAIGALSILAFVVAGKLGKSTDEAAKDTEELEKQINDLAEEAMAGLDGLESLSGGLEDLGKTAKKVAEDIEKLEKQISNTIESNAKKQKNFKEDLAEAFIEQEGKVRDILLEIGEQQISDKKAIKDKELQILQEKEAKTKLQLIKELTELKKKGEAELLVLHEKLAEEKQALQSNATLRGEIQAELVEMQRRSQLTDFELRVENLLRQRKEDLKAFAEKLQLQLAELKALKDQHSAIEQAEAEHTAKLKVEADKRAANEESSARRINSARASIQLFNTGGITTPATRGIPSPFSAGTSTPSFSFFEHGGKVPGPQGRAVPVIAHGQEQIIPAGQSSKGGSTFNVVINNPRFATREDEARIRRMLDDYFRPLLVNHKISA